MKRRWLKIKQYFTSGLYSSTVVESFELATERRARNRDEFQQHLCDKEAVAALLKEKLRQEEEEKQKMDIAKLRQQQVRTKFVTFAFWGQGKSWSLSQGLKAFF